MSRSRTTDVVIVVVGLVGLVLVLTVGGLGALGLYDAFDTTPEEERALEQADQDALCGVLGLGDTGPGGWIAADGTLAIDPRLVGGLSLGLSGAERDSPISAQAAVAKTALTDRVDQSPPQPLTVEEQRALDEISTWHEQTC